MQTNRPLFKIILVLLGGVTGLLLVELGLMVWNGVAHRPQLKLDEQARENSRFFEYDELLGWKGKALASGSYRGPGYTFAVRLNSQGLREREVSFEKAKGTLRIMILGDSQTWGLGVESEERFSEVLERLLRKRERAVEVLNFGMNGYGTDQELLLFKKAGTFYQPDVVIVTFFWNDLFENSRSKAYGYPKPYFAVNPKGELDLRNVPVPRKEGIQSQESPQFNGKTETFKDWFKLNSFAFRVLEEVVGNSPFLYRIAVKSGVAAGPKRDPGSSEWKITKRLLEAIKSVVEASGGKFLVVVIPEHSDFRAGMHDLRRSLLEEMVDLNCLDLFPAMSVAGSAKTLYYPNDIHLNAKGHYTIGGAISEYLLKKISIIGAKGSDQLS